MSNENKTNNIFLIYSGKLFICRDTPKRQPLSKFAAYKRKKAQVPVSVHPGSTGLRIATTTQDRQRYS